MDEKQYAQIMTLLKDIKKRVMLLSVGVGFSVIYCSEEFM